MSSPDHIHIAGLELRVHLGVPEAERAQPQRVTVFLTYWLEHGLRDLDDDLARTIDYAAVCATVKTLAAERPRRLLETLAEDIARGVLRAYHPACRAVEVELRKYVLPDTDFVAVRLRRATQRDALPLPPAVE
ncbi:MAG: dihydroneopterin aldolase [Verrucomicrobia bacterium]|nr:dihydroneopterin aldolase [Verrucomicrobiota bacterium]